MTKIKIVQMTLAVASDSVNGFEERSEYLDDQGRVWYQDGHRETLPGDTDPTWITEWKQLELPDEPTEN